LENDRSTGDALQALRSKYDDGEAGSEDVDTEGGGQPQEPDEEAVVPPTDTVADPRTMVIESFHANIAASAMLGSRRPVDFACDTKFQLHNLVIHESLLVHRFLKACRRIYDFFKCREGAFDMRH